MNYYPFHIGDYSSATRHLSWDEDAAYRRLLDVFYTTEKPLPADERAVFRLVLATTEIQREAVRVVLAEFWKLTDEGWTNGRAQSEIDRMHGLQQKQRDRANKRWHGKEDGAGNAAANATGMPRHTEGDATASKVDASALPPTPTPTPKEGYAQADAGQPVPPKVDPKEADKPVTAATWKAYSEAYAAEYGAQPIRNAKVNGQLRQLVDRLGADKAPLVAEFFVKSKNDYYAKRLHPVDLLLSDAEKLHTEWATGRVATTAKSLPNRDFLR